VILKAIIDDQIYSLDVPDTVIAQGEDFFAGLDRDMDKGWQMSREWVNHPDQIQRGQIVANKLLTALENENRRLGLLMAGYLLTRLPNLDEVEIDVQGEIQNTVFRFRGPAPDTRTDAGLAAQPTPAAVQAGTPNGEAEAQEGMSQLEAMEQAGNDVTKVFRVGKAYRFSVFDHHTGEWQDSPMIADAHEADRLRQAAFKRRYDALRRGGN
jgi:hypothetical protein